MPMEIILYEIRKRYRWEQDHFAEASTKHHRWRCPARFALAFAWCLCQ